MLVFKYDSKNMIDIIDSNNNVIGYFFFNERVADDGERFLESQLIGNIKAPIYKPKKAEAFHQKDVPGRLRGISGVDEARDLGESAAKCMTELMQTKEGG